MSKLRSYGILFSFFMPMGAQVSVDAHTPEQAREIANKFLSTRYDRAEVVEVTDMGEATLPPNITLTDDNNNKGSMN